MLTKNDLSQIEGVVGKVVDNKLKPVNNKLDKIQKDLNASIRVFDDDVAKLRQRVSRIESHLDISPTI